jgi:uncharacterized protein YbaR (Trm112 family)
MPENFESLLRCPDCHGDLARDAAGALVCAACGYQAPNLGGVFNLLPSAERAELYPGDRDDVIDFSVPSHAAHLLEGWDELEGSFGNLYRWIGERATARLGALRSGPQRLRVRGFAHPSHFQLGSPVRIELSANGQRVLQQNLDRPGLFVLEADLPAAQEYLVEIAASPLWSTPSDGRLFTVNISMIRLVPRD